ncbi:ABC transporter ATP-binding protein [Clostridia bacterium]|nr:ABC transporter ATP-binding protein [Clostridia bacterium]
MIDLSVTNLHVRIGASEILDGIDFVLDEPICMAIVGLSGSGKTMFARALMGLLPVGSEVTGEYLLGGGVFDFNAKEAAWREVRGKAIGLIMQDPFTALDPLGKCGDQILAGVPKDRKEAFDVKAALSEVGLPASVEGRFPFELSGGQRQRVVIAASLATEPKLLIADEATTALDVITQQEILDLIDGIRRGRGMPLIFITHDIGLVCKWADRIMVVENGRVVETGPAREITRNPKEAYTRTLAEADRLLNGAVLSAPGTSERIVLAATGLTKQFGKFRALDAVSLEVRVGECIGVVGESGSGKTTLARLLVGLEHPDKGRIEYFGKGLPQIVFQDPYSSLNPAHTVRAILTEALLAGGSRGKGGTQATLTIEELLQLAELPAELLDRKPARLSGGQRQRVAIARALAPGPEVLILDESVSALDVVVQNQILQTISRLRRERDLAIILITHDLSVVRMVASRIYVMSEAHVVEFGETARIFAAPRDPYTAKLLAAAAYADIPRENNPLAETPQDNTRTRNEGQISE